MSKSFPLVVLAALAALLPAFYGQTQAQSIQASVKLFAGFSPRADVSGQFLDVPANQRNIRFITDVAGISDLGDRITNVQATDRDGKPVPLRRFNSAEYVADGKVVGWSYSVDLRPRGPRSWFAHISWIEGDQGIIMLDDILPLGTRSNLSIARPDGWQIIRKGDISTGLFLVGNSWRVLSQDAKKPFVPIIGGTWQFTDEEFASQVEEVYRAYEKLFGPLSTEGSTAQIAITRFPGQVGWDQWEAATRGRNVTIVSSDTPFRSQSAQRLHEQLRHEIFHLWMPCRMSLTGSYDWFYEGFALYQSLKLGVKVGRIRFEDMLATLGRSIDFERSLESKVTLIDASKQRWIGRNDSMVYTRGMLVAFLCDLALLERSGGKMSTDRIVREVYDNGTEARDGNEIILKILRAHPELIPITDRYIAGALPIDWPSALKPAGIDMTTRDGLTKLVIASKVSGGQRALLRKLSYNSSLE